MTANLWPDDWRGTLAEVFDPQPLTIKVVVVGEDGRYTGQVFHLSPGPQREEFDATIAGQRAPGVTVAG